MKKAEFANEAALCAAFIAALPDEWVAYPETCGFDIVLARRSDGFQIGIEAKMTLNAKVLNQACEELGYYHVTDRGPDCRAALVPHGFAGEDMRDLAYRLGVTVITMKSDVILTAADRRRHWDPPFNPPLPSTKNYSTDSQWFEAAPYEKLKLPDYVPDVAAGASGPTSLTPWKVAAIKLAIVLERRGCLTRRDFQTFGVSMSRWTQSQWLLKGAGYWTRGPHFPDFRGQHPVNFLQIEADFEKWSLPEHRVPVSDLLSPAPSTLIDQQSTTEESSWKQDASASPTSGQPTG